jgi:acetyl esterase/lipase
LVKLQKIAMAIFVLLPCAHISHAQEAPQQPLQEATEPESPPPFEQLYKMPVVYSVPGMDQVEVRRNIIYKSVDAVPTKLDLKLDVYIPAGAKSDQRFPAVVLISGGGADTPDWRDAGVYVGYGRILAGSGFVGIPFSKRYARGAEGSLQGLGDFNDMVRYVRAHAAELHVDPDRMAFWAFSGGGTLLSPVLSQMRPFARAAVCFYCIAGLDFPSLSADDRAKMTAKLSPFAQIEHADHPIPPIFVGRAGWDSSDLNRNLDRFIAEALAKNLSIEVMNHPHGRHSFDIIDPGPRSREIIQQALEFLKMRLQRD